MTSWGGVTDDVLSQRCKDLLVYLGSMGGPFAFRFVDKPDGSAHLFFCGSVSSGSPAIMHRIQVPGAGSGQDGEVPLIPWGSAVNPPHLSRPMSKEEELLRERQRARSFGITSFEYNANARRFLIPASGSIFVAPLPAGADQLLTLTELQTAQPGPRMDPKLSPDGRLVAFVRDRDLWVVDLAKPEREHRVTDAASYGPHVSCAVAEYNVQEEFDRYTGYWWAPKPTSSGSYCIAYAVVDEAPVAEYFIPNGGIAGQVDLFRYPLAGEANARVNIEVVEIARDSLAAVPRRLATPLLQEFPWHEYMVRAGWTPTGRHIWLQLLDRAQQRLSMQVLSLDDFIAPGKPGPSFGKGSFELVDERTSVWINVSHVLHFFDDDSGRFIWASERSAFRHLYLMTFNAGSGEVQSRQLTSGEWQVDTSRIWVDEASQRVFFVGTVDSPLEAHLYSVSFASSDTMGTVHRLTEPGFKHDNITMDAGCNRFVSNATSLQQLRKQTCVCAVSFAGAGDARPVVTPLARLDNPAPLEPPCPIAIPHLFNFVNNRNETVYGCYFLPAGYQEGRSYPTVLYVYGGPHVQLVANHAASALLFKQQILSSLGYLVVMIDGIGSARRGLRFEGHLRNVMGQVEVADQIAGLEHLMKEHTFVDRSRIGVTGWSYGGYMTLLCMSQRADFFKVGISGAPVSEWEAYDTGYTERYMNTPQNNPEGYAKGRVMHYADGFPDEEGRLLIVHGLIDENVHFCHTSRLIEALIARNKPYKLMIFPQSRHGVSKLEERLYFEMSSAKYFRDNL